MECSVQDCQRAARATGLCSRHYMIKRRYGDEDANRYHLTPSALFAKHVAQGAPEKCWLWKGHTGGRYGHIKIDGVTRTSSRFAYEVHVGPIPKGMFVLHRCDNPPCCNPAHLFLGTQLDNMRDKFAKGRHRPAGPKGDRCSLTKLTETQVREIRASTAANGELAQQFGVHPRTIYDVRRGHTWKHI